MDRFPNAVDTLQTDAPNIFLVLWSLLFAGFIRTYVDVDAVLQG